MSGRVVCRYSEAFKRTVVADLESGRLDSIGAAKRQYGITGATTVQSWLKKYGKNEHLPRVIRVETPDERDQLNALRKENDRLKRTLAETHMKAVLYESWLDVACQEFGVSDVEGFKKKLAERS